MAEATKMARIFSSAHAAALAFAFVAKVDGAQQPVKLRAKLKERVSGNLTFDEFEASAKAVAEVVVREAKGRYVQLITRAAGSRTFEFSPWGASAVFLNLEARAVEIKGTDPLSDKFRKALAKLNGDGLEDKEIPPPPNPQLGLFD